MENYSLICLFQANFALRHFDIIDQQGMSSVHPEIVLFSTVLLYFTGMGDLEEDLLL